MGTSAMFWRCDFTGHTLKAVILISFFTKEYLGMSTGVIVLV